MFLNWILLQNLVNCKSVIETYLKRRIFFQDMEFITVLGLIAGILVTSSFIPQIIKIRKLKETKDISLWMYIIFITGIFLWLVYGIIIKDVPVMFANAIGLCFASSILFFKIKYG